MKLLISPPLRPYTFLIACCLALQVLLWCSGCVAYTENSGIAIGADASKIKHKFGESITFTDLETSPAFIAAAEETGDIADNLIIAGVAKEWLGNERAAADGADAISGKQIDAGVEQSAQQVDLEKTKLLLEAEAAQ